MPVLANPKHERFAQLCAKGLPLVKAYVQAGFKYNTGNPSTMARRPEIKARIEELTNQLEKAEQKELAEFIKSEGISPAYILRQLLETSVAAKDCGKFDTAIKGFSELGKEMFGMFDQTKTVTVEKNVNNTTTTIAIQDVSTAFDRLTREFAGIEIEGTASHSKPPAAIAPPTLERAIPSLGPEQLDQLFVLDGRGGESQVRTTAS